MVQAIGLIGMDQFHESESTGIIIGYRIAVFRREDDVMMLRIGVMGVGELAELIATQHEATTHAQMHEEPIAGGQVRAEEFCAPGQAFDALPFNTLRKIIGEGKAKVGAVQLNVRNPAAFQNGREPAPNRLDFGEFRDGV